MRHWYKDIKEATDLPIGPGFSMTASRIVINEEGDHIGEVVIGKNCRLINATVSAKIGAKIRIGDNAVIRGRIVAEKDSCITIGDHFVCNAAVDIKSGDQSNISIGNNCLLANAMIYNTDVHGIYDAFSKKRINRSRDVEISDRVWLAQNSIVLKGVHIGSDCVVGAGSVVTSSVPRSSVVAGNPAKVVRRGIRWTRNVLDEIPDNRCHPVSEAETKSVTTWRRKLWFRKLLNWWVKG